MRWQLAPAAACVQTRIRAMESRSPAPRNVGAERRTSPTRPERRNLSCEGGQRWRARRIAWIASARHPRWRMTTVSSSRGGDSRGPRRPTGRSPSNGAAPCAGQRTRSAPESAPGQCRAPRWLPLARPRCPRRSNRRREARRPRRRRRRNHRIELGTGVAGEGCRDGFSAARRWPRFSRRRENRAASARED